MNRLKYLLLISASFFVFTECYYGNCIESEEGFIEDSQDRTIKKRSGKLKRSRKSQISNRKTKISKQKRSKKNDSKRILSVLRLCKKPENKKACERLQLELPKAIRNMDQPDEGNNRMKDMQNLSTAKAERGNAARIIASETIPVKTTKYISKKPTKICYRLNDELSSQLREELDTYRKAEEHKA